MGIQHKLPQPPLRIVLPDSPEKVDRFIDSPWILHRSNLSESVRRHGNLPRRQEAASTATNTNSCIARNGDLPNLVFSARLHRRHQALLLPTASVNMTSRSFLENRLQIRVCCTAGAKETALPHLLTMVKGGKTQRPGSPDLARKPQQASLHYCDQNRPWGMVASTGPKSDGFTWTHAWPRSDVRQSEHAGHGAGAVEIIRRGPHHYPRARLKHRTHQVSSTCK